MTEEIQAPPIKQLVKDGVWQVPPEQRPKNWQTMAVREYEETTTHTRTKTKRATEVLIQEKPAPDPTPAEVIEVTEAIAEKSKEIAVQIISHLPKDGDYVDKILDCLHRTELLDIDRQWGDWEREQEILGNHQTELAHWRAAKETTDLILSYWVDRHKEKLRHVGIGSVVIKDLWKVVHEAICQQLDRTDTLINEAKEETREFYRAKPVV